LIASAIILAARAKLLSVLPQEIKQSAGRRRRAMSFALYAAGFAIVIAGLIYAAYLMHVPAHWIAVGAIILLGMGIVTGVKNTRQKDPPS
jgi:hypothetical protein